MCFVKIRANSVNEDFFLLLLYIFRISIAIATKCDAAYTYNFIDLKEIDESWLTHLQKMLFEKKYEINECV